MQTDPLSKRSPISSQQEDAIKLLASGCTLRFTALLLRIKDSTIRQWVKRDADFKAKLAACEQASSMSSSL
jgi:hypothetical protein